MVKTIDVRLAATENDTYILEADDGNTYTVPIAACTLLDGLLMPVDESNYIRVCLSSKSQNSELGYQATFQDNNEVCKNKNPESKFELPVLMSTPTSTKKKWMSASIKNLIHHYKLQKHLFGNTSIRADEVWKKIQRNMSEEGFTFTVEQIKTKFSKLKQSYSKVRDNNFQTGASPMDFPWMDEFEIIFGKDHDVSPVATATSSNFTPLNEKKESSEQNIIPKRGLKTTTERILANLEKMQEERTVRQRERDAERRQERNEMLMAIRSNNELFGKVVEKLTDKIHGGGQTKKDL